MNERPLRLLHVGCGQRSRLGPPPPFTAPQWEEVRLDIDSGVEPDILASITDMGVIPSGSFDAVLSAHNLEHLYAHEVPLALAEFRRVLSAQGFAVITVPDLKRVAEWVANDRLFDVAYVAPVGPVSPVDILWGYRPALAGGNHYMAHRSGFTAKTLEQALREVGFLSVSVRPDPHWAVWAVASLQDVDQAATEALAATLAGSPDSGAAPV